MNLPLPPGQTGLPFLGEIVPYLRDSFAFVAKRVRRHGPVFRTRLLGRDTVVIAGPDACALWLDESNIVRRGSQPNFVFQLLAGPNLRHLDDEAHRRRKRLVLAGFSRGALAAYLPGLVRITRAALKRWTDLREFLWLPELKRLAIEGICTNFLGWEPGDEMEDFVRQYETVLEGTGRLPVSVPGTRYSRALTARNRLLATFESAIEKEKHKKSGAGLSRILEARLPDGTKVTPGELKRESYHIVIAGYIIFAQFVEMILRLKREPGLKSSLQAEVRRSMPRTAPGPQTPTLEQLDELPGLSRFVMEAKRLCPVLSTVYAKARRTCEFQDYRIPRGWTVLLALRATLLAPHIYRDSETFDPDRFAEPRSEHLRHPHAFVPHGPGPVTSHHCAGTDYTTYFMKVLAVELLESGLTWDLAADPKFNWRRTPPEPRDGLLVQLHTPDS